MPDRLAAGERASDTSGRLRLGINIDHVATVRNARGGTVPDPVRAAHLAAEAGADGITAHLREDRRHIRDADIERLAAELTLPLNFEMATTDEMQAIALRHRPHAVCLVPERREERTTEGGLEVASDEARLARFIAPLAEAGCRVSLFIAADRRQVEAAGRVGAAVVELHTGAYCDAWVEGRTQARDAELARLTEMATFAHDAGARGPRRARAELCQRRTDRRSAAGDRAQHRPFPDRRGDLRRLGRRHPQDARRDGRGAGRLSGVRSASASARQQSPRRAGAS